MHFLLIKRVRAFLVNIMGSNKTRVNERTRTKKNKKSQSQSHGQKTDRNEWKKTFDRHIAVSLFLFLFLCETSIPKAHFQETTKELAVVALYSHAVMPCFIRMNLATDSLELFAPVLTNAAVSVSALVVRVRGYTVVQLQSRKSPRFLL